MIIALDTTGSKRAAGIVPHLVRSVPTDPDRALFPENDDYERLVGRVIRRSTHIISSGFSRTIEVSNTNMEERMK